MSTAGIGVVAALALGCSAEDPEPSAEQQVTWCQALSVIESKCQRCHSEPPQNGAPFPLLTYDDTQVLLGAEQTPVYSKMRVAVGLDYMPLTAIPLDPPVQPLTCEEKTTLLRWLDEGAQPVGGLDCASANTPLLGCDPQ